tara:strand:+ start:2586 stop:3191 length:606 start_codon:yes stop_codon:yes gene_type:complete
MSLLLDYLFNIFSYLNSGLGILFFGFIYILIVIFILPASWLSLVAGFLYGQYLGSLIVFISAFCGATLAFFISKKFLYERIKKVISRFPRFSKLEKIVEKGGLRLIILTRLSPLFPFSLLNYFYGLNNISYRNFAIGLLSILPGTYLYCSLGSLANNLNDIRNMRFDNNLLTTTLSIISTFLVIILLAKYAREVIEESENY